MMWRTSLVLAAGVALCFISLPNASHAQNPQWQQYHQHLQQRRVEQQQRYDQWGRQLDGRYQEWRSPPPNEPPQQSEGQVNVRGLGIQPGQYNVRLPFGLNLRVNVPQEQQAQPQPAQTPSYVIGSVQSLAGEIERSLRSLHYEARRTGANEARGQLEQALQEIAAVRNVAAQGAAPQQLTQQFQRFDEIWHQLAFRLRNDPEAAQWAAAHMERVNRADERIHQILQISPARGYDRVQVAALTSQLSSGVQQLVQELEPEGRRDWSTRRLQRAAERAQRYATDLNDAVQHDDPLDEIVAQYERFDQEWHGLLSLAQENRDVGRQVWRVGRQVSQIDRQLHELLMIDSPLAAGPRASAYARSLSQSANNLLQLVRNLERGGVQAKDLESDAEDVARAASDFHQWLQQSERPADRAQGRMRHLMRQWEDLQKRVATFDANRFPQIHQYAEAVQNDLARLQRELGG